MADNQFLSTMGSVCLKSQDSDDHVSHRPTISKPEPVGHASIEPRAGNFASAVSENSRRSIRSRFGTLDETYAINNTSQVLSDAYKGDSEVIKQHIKNGFHVDFPLNNQGWTLIHIAAQTGNVDMMKMLIDCDCDLDTQEVAEGWTPLMIAAINNMYDVANLLVINGCDLFLRDNSGKNAEDLATKYRSASVSSMLGEKS